ncbi:sensor histidine kinase [Modestobacter marinus]|uniref:sensor histidine kinase n=1 Tax=Modestobacter marinus TaxID=477641 RepID=UPI001C9826E6|nr:ATP-binding protein [Modestobacter marinus]
MPRPGRTGRSWRERRAALTTVAGVVAFVAAVYAAVVGGGGLLLGRTGAPSPALSVLATAVVALGIEPVQTRLERRAARRASAGRPSPEEALRRFRAATGAAVPAQELPGRIARTLAEATGVAQAQVWLDVRGRPALVAAEPPGAPDGDGLVHVLEVRHAGERLGELRLHRPPGRPATAAEERLVGALAGQAGLALRGARLRAELTDRLAELSARAEELRASRERLVAAQDDERRRLERDVHDGAQQHLVALAVQLRLVQAVARRDPGRATELLGQQAAAARTAVDTVQALSRGIYPAVLTERGLPAALSAAAAASPIPVRVSADDVGRYPAGVEAALYFTGLEALQNAVKHSGARQVTLRVATDDGAVVLTVEDDGRGFDPGADPGAGLANMRDRLDAVGGALQVAAAPGRGVRVRATAPAEPVPGG